MGNGFGIPIILRYILEFCESTAEATEVLKRIPSHMSYNVTVLNRSSQFATVFVAPDRPTVVSRQPLATNHQHQIEWPEHEQATGSLNRAHFLALRMHEEFETRERFISGSLNRRFINSNTITVGAHSTRPPTSHSLRSAAIDGQDT